MSTQGHLQIAARAEVDALSAAAMLRAAQEEYAAAAIIGDDDRMLQAKRRAFMQLDILLSCTARQKANQREAMLAISG